MSRLIGFGCSFTYGHGLIDCFDPPFDPGKKASEYSWVGCLSRQLKIPSINLARPGSSNLEILYRILNFKFEPNDIAVILWTDIARDLIWKKEPDYPGDLEFQPIGSWMTLDNDKIDYSAWLSLHSDIDLIIRTWFCVHHAECFLENRGIKNLSFFINTKEMFDNVPEYITTKNVSKLDASSLLFTNDLALDSRHPGPQAHNKFAEYICGLLNG